uniref:OCIA domain-containing protein n=1 Tax=Strigamia maritima TaxID=126957 RepID=T1IRH9_STRMM
MASFEKNLMVHAENPSSTVPHEPPTAHPQKIRLTPEEIKVLRECNRESFYFRCVPFSTVAMASVHFAVKSGYLRPNPRWGSAFKVMTAGFIGYIVGKFSYQQKCVEKIMQLPNSHLGEALRKKQERGNYDKLDIDIGESLRSAQRTGAADSSNFNYEPVDRIGVDTDKNIVYEGLDDSMRPTLDSESTVKDDVPTPVPSRYTTYDELRDKNRSEYDNKIRDNFLKRTPEPKLPPQLPPPPPTVYSDPPAKPVRQKKGKYGDVWDD